MARKGGKSTPPAEPLKLFYIFYNKERWDNWLKTLRESSFEVNPDGDEMPEGFRMLDSFSEDITIEVLKIIRLYQNNRFDKDDAMKKVGEVEKIVMSEPPEDLEEVVEILQLPKAVLFAACRKFLDSVYEKDIKALVKKGRSLKEDDMEQALEIAAQIGANVINGTTCCRKFLKDDLEQPTLFDEWLIECERMNEAMESLKDFDESAGEDD
ncbi:MAG: DUF2150 family protein [Methanomicrobiales archaeon]|nr:DUF2150 family protein [Methanomicrobiales archaeon]